jgi:aminopeptidase N
VKGANTVELLFSSDYRDDGTGLHSFVDKADNQQYLFTDLEPAYAHMVFPNFDQPSIRSSWQFNALAPKDWQVVSNEQEDAKSSKALEDITLAAKFFNKTLDKSMSLRSFKKTP